MRNAEKRERRPLNHSGKESYRLIAKVAVIARKQDFTEVPPWRGRNKDKKEI